MFLILLCLFGLEEVANGFEPIDPQTLVFRENLRFGSVTHEDDAYLWAASDTSLAVDAKGHIFVSDTDEARILEFDATGKLVRVLASRGQGPGELMSLSSFHILKDGSAIAQESLRMRVPNTHYFDSSMTFTKRVMAEGDAKYIVNAVFAPGGKALLAQYLEFDMEAAKQWRSMALLDTNYKPVVSLSREEQDMNMRKMLEPAYLAGFLGDTLRQEFEPRGFGNFDEKGRFYHGLTTSYEIRITQPGADKPSLVVKRQYKPKPNTPKQFAAMLDRVSERYRGMQRLDELMTPAFMKRVLDKSDLPAAKKPVYGVIPMPEGFLVIHDIDYVNGSQLADIFSAKGTYQGSISRPHWPFLTPTGYPKMIFRNGFAYTIETDEEGENSVVRYKVLAK